MKLLAWNAVITSVIVSLALVGYDRAVRRPATVVGLIDVGEVMKRQHAAVLGTVTKPTASERDRARATDRGAQFSTVFPRALDQLAEECGCLVLVRSAVAGVPPNSIDLTARLEELLGLTNEQR